MASNMATVTYVPVTAARSTTRRSPSSILARANVPSEIRAGSEAPHDKSTTDDYRAVDVRRWAREGVLRPGYWGGWQWTRDGETVASIQMRVEQDRVILIYRHRSGSEECQRR
jgi:hypothetical protein